MIADVLEESHARVVLPVFAADGAALALADLNEVRVTLRDRETSTILNSRDGTVTPAPNVVAAGAAVVWEVQPADNVVVHPHSRFEVHEGRVDYVYGGTRLGRVRVLLRVRNLGIGTLTPPPVPAPGAPSWSFYQPLAGARPGRTFTLPTAAVAVVLFYQGDALWKADDPGLGEFGWAGATVTTGFDVQPGDALWAHVLA